MCTPGWEDEFVKYGWPMQITELSFDIEQKTRDWTFYNYKIVIIPMLGDKLYYSRKIEHLIYTDLHFIGQTWLRRRSGQSLKIPWNSPLKILQSDEIPHERNVNARMHEETSGISLMALSCLISTTNRLSSCRADRLGKFTQTACT